MSIHNKKQRNVENNLILGSVISAFEGSRYNVFELIPRNKNLEIEPSNLPRSKDRFLLNLLDSLGISYTITYRMPNFEDCFVERPMSVSNNSL
jgi:hypothetical protein